MQNGVATMPEDSPLPGFSLLPLRIFTSSSSCSSSSLQPGFADFMSLHEALSDPAHSRPFVTGHTTSSGPHQAYSSH